MSDKNNKSFYDTHARRYTNDNTREYGAAFGFATEISPGAAPLTLDSMRKTVDMTPTREWDGPTSDWDYHCGASTGAFGTLEHFTPGISARHDCRIYVVMPAVTDAQLTNEPTLAPPSVFIRADVQPNHGLVEGLHDRFLHTHTHTHIHTHTCTYTYIQM